MKRALISAAVLGLAVTGISTATAAPAAQKVTGGGQLPAMDDMTAGAEQTLAFTARTTSGTTDGDAAAEQLQFNPRGAGEAAAFHGRVTCLVVTGDEATLAGTRDGGFFRLTVMDVDRGGPQRDAEPLVFEPAAEDDHCGEPAAGDEMSLGRGNVVIHQTRS